MLHWGSNVSTIDSTQVPRLSESDLQPMGMTFSMHMHVDMQVSTGLLLSLTVHLTNSMTDTMHQFTNFDNQLGSQLVEEVRLDRETT